MKILHIIGSIDPVGGGPAQVAVRLAAAQSELGHEVHVVSYGPANSAGEERTREELARVPHLAAVTLHDLGGPTWHERLFARKAVKALAELIPGSDWLHLHGIWERILHKSAVLGKRFGVPYCFVPHGMLHPSSLAQKRRKKQLALALGVRRALDRAAFIHCLNADEVNLIKPFGLLSRSFIFPNGVFLEEIEPLPQPQSFVSKHPSLCDRRFILFLGRLHRVKGLDLLAEAWTACAAKVPDVDLVVAGPDEGAKLDFEARINRARLKDRVHIVGPLYGKEKFAALVDASCFCLPSRQEGFSVAVVEAMACGVPTVISEACHFPEAAATGAAEVVALDATNLADALTRVLSDPPHAQAMARASRNLIRCDYTWPAIAARLIEAYQATIKMYPLSGQKPVG